VIRWLPIASLPHVLQTTPESVPQTAPYLTVSAERVATWRERLGTRGPKIGISWQGNPNYRFDKLRSIPLCEFQPLATIPGIRLVSLQTLPGAEQIGAVPFGHLVEKILSESDFSNDALLDAAAVIISLDLVVTSDTMLAHLAGALGCKTFLALPRVPDWRWLLDRDDCPWYPSVRLFRQTTVGKWGDVFARVGDAVEQMLRR
jgi:hypothetical protein